MSSAYRRDTSYNSGFSLFPEEENRGVLVSESVNFSDWSGIVIVYLLSSFLNYTRLIHA